MTSVEVALALVPIVVVVAPILYAGWIEWLERRPRGAANDHVCRIRKLCQELGQEPGVDPATLSWRRAVQEVNWLENRLKTKQTLERAYSAMGQVHGTGR